MNALLLLFWDLVLAASIAALASVLLAAFCPACGNKIFWLPWRSPTFYRIGRKADATKSKNSFACSSCKTSLDVTISDGGTKLCVGIFFIFFPLSEALVNWPSHPTVWIIVLTLTVSGLLILIQGQLSVKLILAKQDSDEAENIPKK